MKQWQHLIRQQIKRKRRTRDESAALLDTAYDILAEGNP
jgi:hypothetical protein